MSYNAFSIKSFIHEYSELLRKDYKGFTARPWNRFRPEETKWWVVPSTAWPSFGNEKLCFWCSGNYLYGGYNVEKGIEVSRDDLQYDAKNILMTPEWKWNHFLKDCSTGEIDLLVDSFYEKVNFPVHMNLSANLVNEISGYDPYGNKKSDNIEFSITDDTMRICEKELKISALSPFENIEGLREIPESLEDVTGLNWLWIDVMIFAPIYYIKSGSSYNINRLRKKMSVFEERIFSDCKINK
ncbi:MAG: hypothetical protein J6L92_06795 [Clostridia bacterium]|nr:hypothetical protein [Clostridia bacterium]